MVKVASRRLVARGLVLVLPLLGLVAVAPAQHAAAVCGTACSLFAGTKKVQLDTSFVAPAGLEDHAETSTVSVIGGGGTMRMYYRSFRYMSGGTLHKCGQPTGIGMATSADGNVWTAHNSSLPLSGLASTDSSGNPTCPPQDNTTPDIWRFAPDVEVDGSQYDMAFEIRDTVHQSAVVDEINGATSTDGINWTNQRTLLTPTAGGFPGGIGTPDLVHDGSTWKLLFHGYDSPVGKTHVGSFHRALATGGASFSNAFSVTNSNVIPPQGPVAQTAVSWYDFGPGLGDIVSENGVYYQLFEGFTNVDPPSESGICNKTHSTPRIGLAKSTNLSTWTVSSHAPIFEISQNGTSCGHDMPNWQMLPDGTLTFITPADPPSGAPVRWKIVDGTPQGPPTAATDRLLPNHYLASGAQLSTPRGDVLRMQTDGNLVEIQAGGTPIWNSHTAIAGSRAIMQTDGNFVIYHGSDPVASTRTNGNPQAFLILQNTDENLVVYAPGTVPVWNRVAHPEGMFPE